MLQRRVQQIRETRRRCGFGAVGEQLPGLIRDIHSTIAAGREVKVLVALAVVVHVQLATQVGEPDNNSDRLGFGFGPTNVGLWEMALALEAGEPDRAVSVAQTLQPQRHLGGVRAG